MKTSNDYLTIFGVSEAQMRALASEGMKGGGNWCDLFFEDTSYSDLLLRDGKVSSGGSHIDYGCGIRVLNGEKTGYAYSESTDYPSLLAAAKAAATIASAGTARSGGVGSAVRTDAVPGSHYGMLRDWRQEETSAFVPVLEKLDAMVRAKDTRTHKVIALLSWQVSDILMYNSLGETSFDSRPLGSISLTSIFVQDGKTEMTSCSRSFRSGVEMISGELLEELASEAVRGVDERFDARRPKGGRMSVVMGAGASGILLHEAMGHAFEADFNRKGQSIFCDKMGKRVAAEGINIIDDGTVPGNRGSCNYDDEGVPAQRTCMVEDGILRSFLHDRISANWYGVSPTGNGRRESFRYNPIPRMRCTYMESGRDGSVEDLIASVEKGVFVDQFSNGEVKIGEGDFTFYVKSGRLIEKGRLTMPVKDINIVGNGPRALADIRAVASDLTIDNGTWTCGKEQSVPVGCGIPSVLVENLTVGGE